MNIKTEKLRERTKQFALRVIRLFRSLPASSEARTVGDQLLRCGTLVGAKYISACHALSKAQFAARIGLVAELAEESVFWIELLSERGITEKADIDALLKEARELAKIFAKSRQTTKRRKR